MLIIFAVGLIEWTVIQRSFPDKLTEKLNQQNNSNFVAHKDEA